MNTKSLFGIFLLLLTVSFVSCSDDDKHPSLSVPELVNNILFLDYPIRSTSYTHISGGTAPYTVSCQSDILNAYMSDSYPNRLIAEASGVGNIPVMVSDANGHTITVDVTIGWSETQIKIASREVYVVGDDLTINQHKELEEKALSTIPVEDNGIYLLEYTDKESGTLYIYKTPYGSTRYVGTFTKSEVEVEGNAAQGYEFEFDGNRHRFYQYVYWPSNRVEMTPTYALYEDLTEQFVQEYLGLESLVTIQVLE